MFFKHGSTTGLIFIIRTLFHNYSDLSECRLQGGRGSAAGWRLVWGPADGKSERRERGDRMKRKGVDD